MSNDSLLNKIAVVEPKKVYVGTVLLPYIRKIMDALYMGNSTDALLPMKGLIASLGTKAQKDLADINIKLESYEDDIGKLQRKDMEQLFQKLMKYLHKTYLKGLFARLEQKDLDRMEEDEE